jgi:RimJ/RimL family protein N-acetyltransferase
MGQHLNEYGQPIGASLAGWKPPPAPPHTQIEGQYAALVPVDPAAHAPALYAAFAAAPDARMWTYLPYGPFADVAAYRAWLEAEACGADPLFFTIVRRSDAQPVGLASYLRIAQGVGVVEVGHLQFSPALQRSVVATEAMFLMMRRAFALGYRRYEWKCDALNAPSRAAAERYGFTYEGTFRNAIVYKQRTRDTAWYSVTDSEWPALERALVTWLSPDNFDASGGQRRRLAALRD